MADPFVAEIRIFGFNFAPRGWAFCNGQILPLSQNTALFSLLGTVYGGDGKSTFALPNIQGQAVMHPGQGQGLSLRDQGEMGGAESITLITSEIPFHTHTLRGTVEDATQGSLTADVILAQTVNGNLYQTNSSANLATMAPQALAPAGGSLPHNNMMPYLVMNFCIALQGVFPPRG
jgi:microcystin-dependent protein